jgi:hypothetical protein
MSKRGRHGQAHHHEHQAGTAHSLFHSQASHAGHLEDKIVHNLVELQKIHTDVAEKFTKLSNQLASLLTLFEMTARSFAQQSNNPALEKDKEFLDKIDKLLDQNKTIAKGLTLMEEKMRERLYGPTQPSSQMPQRAFTSIPGLDAPRPLPKL